MSTDRHFLRVRRERAGWTPKQLANEVGVNYQTIAAIESGLRNCGPELFERIDRAIEERMRKAAKTLRDD